MKKLLFLAIITISGASATRAQLPFSPGLNPGLNPAWGFNQYRMGALLSDSNALTKKWSLVPFASLSTGMQFWNGTSATMISAPVGLQLNRQLNKNLYAFAAITTAPTYFNMNTVFPSTGFGKNYTGFGTGRSNNFGAFSRAEAGLMYINDERTFSISGSIGVNHYYYQPFCSPLINSARPNPTLVR